MFIRTQATGLATHKGTVTAECENEYKYTRSGNLTIDDPEDRYERTSGGRIWRETHYARNEQYLVSMTQDRIATTTISKSYDTSDPSASVISRTGNILCEIKYEMLDQTTLTSDTVMYDKNSVAYYTDHTTATIKYHDEENDRVSIQWSIVETPSGLQVDYTATLQGQGDLQDIEQWYSYSVDSSYVYIYYDYDDKIESYTYNQTMSSQDGGVLVNNVTYGSLNISGSLVPVVMTTTSSTTHSPGVVQSRKTLERT